MESDTVTSDFLIEELGGCGLFQAVFCVLAYLPHIAVPFSALLMSFGAYNPGWRCLDNSTQSHLSNVSETSSNATEEDSDGSHNVTSNYIVHSCQEYAACGDVQFDPDVSTIVTEWGLLCDKEWVVPLIIIIQISGGLIGGFLLGYLGDKFGRRFTLYTHLLIHATMILITIFSVSWEMFVTLQFFTAVCHPILIFLPIAYKTEFVPRKLRSVVGSVPVWSVGAILFSVVTMLTKSWKHICIILVFIDLVAFLPVFWVPESFRWLVVNGKTDAYLKAAKKIATWNKSRLDEAMCMKLIEDQKNRAKGRARFGVLDLFRKGYVRYAVVLGYAIISVNMSYYITLLGAAFLPGNFYMKMIILTTTEIPTNMLASFVPNYLGRKISISGAFAVSSCSLVGAMLVHRFVIDDDETRRVGVLVLVVVGKCFCGVAWYVMAVFLVELYPTVVRTSASGYGGFVGVVGALLAPYLIPTDAAYTFYRNYSIMVGLIFTSGIFILFLPETKGKPMKDVFEIPLKKCSDRLTEKGRNGTDEDLVAFRS